jgi:hypothetical protein
LIIARPVTIVREADHRTEHHTREDTTKSIKYFATEDNEDTEEFLINPQNMAFHCALCLWPMAMFSVAKDAVYNVLSSVTGISALFVVRHSLCCCAAIMAALFV